MPWAPVQKNRQYDCYQPKSWYFFAKSLDPDPGQISYYRMNSSKVVVQRPFVFFGSNWIVSGPINELMIYFAWISEWDRVGAHKWIKSVVRKIYIYYRIFEICISIHHFVDWSVVVPSKHFYKGFGLKMQKMSCTKSWYCTTWTPSLVLRGQITRSASNSCICRGLWNEYRDCRYLFHWWSL